MDSGQICSRCAKNKAVYGRAWCAICIDESDNVVLPKDDPISSPAHYKFGQYEVIDIIKAWTSDCGLTPYQAFLWASLQQYLFRFPKKKGPQDLKKAMWYIERLLKEYDE